jgi:formylglycine-generating enzyme required for sulfatase activity
MGDHFGGGYSNELPLHFVEVSDFYMGATEVTQAEWSQYMPAQDWSSFGTGDTYPAYSVSWYEIIKYCNLRSIDEGLTPCYTISSSTDPADWGTVPTSSNTTWDAATCSWNANGYRLPSEAEWEYAARGGIHNADNLLYSGCHLETDLTNYAWYVGNQTGASHPVGEKLPNQLGLYDMTGNLFEWCWDWYGSYTSDVQIYPTGPTTGSRRVVRGSNWYNIAYDCRVANRYDDYPYYSTFYYGFRLSRTP